jgi:hypothetical protein
VSASTRYASRFIGICNGLQVASNHEDVPVAGKGKSADEAAQGVEHRIGLLGHQGVTCAPEA